MPQPSPAGKCPCFHPLQCGLPQSGDYRRGIQENRSRVSCRQPRSSLREMNALRNALIHNYEGADPELVWAVVDRDITALLAAMRRLVGGEEKQ